MMKGCIKKINYTKASLLMYEQRRNQDEPKKHRQKNPSVLFSIKTQQYYFSLKKMVIGTPEKSKFSRILFSR